MKTRFILIIIPLLTLALALAGGFTLLWRFFVFLMVILLLSYLWPRLTIRGIDSRVRKFSDYCQVGKHFEEEFTVFNHSKIPAPFIEVQEDTDLPGYQNSVAFNLSSQSSYYWRTKVNCRRRGEYNIGALDVKVTDPFGFFALHRHFGKHQRVIVYPEIVDLPLFQALPRQEPGISPRHWPVSEMGPNASRVREYASGDSLRHIHWRTTAHTSKLMVKEFDPDRTNYSFKDIWIVLDMHQDFQMGEGDETTEEYGIKIAASLVKKYIDSGKRVGLLVSGDHSYVFQPDAGEQHLNDMLRALALIKATGEVSVDTLLTTQMGRFDSGSAVIVITSSDNQEIAAPLHQVVSRGIIGISILLDSFSFGGRTSAANAARSLITNGINVFIVRRGVDIARALNSRLLSSRIQYIGDRI